MNFERNNKDIKTSLRVGRKGNARHLDYIWVNFEFTHTLSSLKTEEFLKNINSYDNRLTLKPFFAIFVNNSSHINFSELRGQWIIFENEFYQIPE